MKKWTIRHSDKLQFAQTGQRPRPFPGKFPTRVAWEVKNSDGKNWSYIGKPSVNATRQFSSKARLAGTTYASFREFDREHLVAQFTGYAPTNRLRNSGACTLANYYRPFWMAEHVTGAEKFYSNKIAGHWIYSHTPEVPIGQIDTHTAWLRGRY